MPNQLNLESPNKQPDSFAVLTQKETFSSTFGGLLPNGRKGSYSNEFLETFCLGQFPQGRLQISLREKPEAWLQDKGVACLGKQRFPSRGGWVALGEDTVLLLG